VTAPLTGYADRISVRAGEKAAATPDGLPSLEFAAISRRFAPGHDYQLSEDQ